MGHVFYRVSLPKALIVEWLKVPAFVEKVSDMIQKQEPVSDETVRPVMLNIFWDMVKTGDKPDDVSLYKLRRSINSIAKVLYPNDYEPRWIPWPVRITDGQGGDEPK